MALQTLSEASILDEAGLPKVVRQGSQLKLKPLEMRAPDEHGEKRLSAERSLKFLTDWLGEGPFTVSRIGQWPCGQIMLYVKGAKSDEPGTRAGDFVAM